MSGEVAVIITGTSMLPSIPPGSYLTVLRVPVEAILVGDVIGYPIDSSVVAAHRIISLHPNPRGLELLTRGDNQDHCERVPAHAVAFKVLRVSRGRFSYSTDGLLGMTLARLAVRGGLPWRLVRALVTPLLRSVARVAPSLVGAARAR